jgi:hypothetical protein
VLPVRATSRATSKVLRLHFFTRFSPTFLNLKNLT